jgi:SAM-dependent methyltransferase
MRYGILGESVIERVLVASRLLPTPMLEGYAMVSTQALLVAAKVGLFEAMVDAPLTATEIAARCDCDAIATEKLCNVLVGMRYLEVIEAERYRPSRMARRWLTGPSSVMDSVLMKELEWRWLDGLEAFVRSGHQHDVHETMSPADWGLYQRGMRSNAGVVAPLVARRLPIPDGAQEMLDIGGSHGYFSVAICKRHAGLRSTILDLPQAVEHAAPLLEAEGMGDRVDIRAGDALADDLGTAAYDVIFMASLCHHFDDEANRDLMRRCATALRPGGMVAIFDAVRLPPGKNDQVGSFFDLYFALTSSAGLWTYEEMADWQRSAGLSPRRPIGLPGSRGNGIQVADKVEHRGRDT